MEKYKKIRVTFEEKVFDKKRKPIYATRKLSVGLVSCMLGFMMFMPTVKAVEEETIPTSQQVQDKDEVLDKTDNHTQEEKEEVTPLIDKGASKIDGEENLSDQKLDGQNKEENTIKEENTDDDLENKDEELLTADEIQAIRDRTNSLENDYFFNDNMVEELKVELRKANADPSVNYEQAKARLIDEAIQKNTPDKQAPGEEKAAVKVKAPTIKTVSIGDKVIKGSGAPSIYVKGKRVNGRVYVSLVDSKGNEKANGFFTRKGYSGNWEVTLSVAAAEGDKVIAYSVVDNRESPRAEVEVKKTLNIINKDKLKMPTGEIWIEQTSSNQVNGDEQAEAIEMLKNANPDIAKDFKSIKFSIDGTDHAYYDVVYTDKSTSGKIEAPSLKIKTVTETSAAPTIEKVHVTDGQIIVTLDKEVAAGTKFYFIKQFTDAEDKSFCDEGKCKVDKSTSQDMTQAVSVDGKKVTFQINAADDLELGRDFGIVVKESHKFRSCTISQPVLTSPDKVAVRDPHKLTDDDKKAIDKAIRDANTINGKSKLPDGTGFVDDPAFIEFDKEGNVRIIKPNDVNGTYDNGKFIPNKKEDGSYDVKKGSSVTTFPAKDLVKNLVPEIPSVEYNETNHQIIISPDKVDTDAQQVEVTYTGTDGNEKKVLATKKEGVWSIDDDQVKVDENGIVSLPTSKVKGGTKVIAKVTDIGGLIEEEKPLTSKPGELYLTKAEKVKDIGGLDPVEIRKWVGDEVDWKEGVKAKDQSNNEEITKLLTEKGTKITDESSRTTEKEGDFEGKIKVTFDDGSSIEVEKQMLYVSNLVTSIDNKNVPTDALEVEFKLGEGTKVDNTSGGAIEGNKDNPTPYSKYNVKPGTNLKEYKLPSINTSVVDSINVTTQDTYTEPVWKDSKNGTHFIASTENKVFIATATKTYKVTLTANGGKGEDKVEVKKTGEKYKLPKGDTFNPPNENQKFSGWMIGDGPDVLDPDKEITVDGDKIIKAIWKPIEFKVTFKTEEGATGSMKDETVTKGSEFKIPEPTFTPDKNKEFAGWKIECQEGLKKAGDRIDKISGDVTLIATWKNIQVNISYDANKGRGSMESKKVDKGSDYAVLPNGFTAPDDTLEFSHWEIDGKEVEANKAIKIDKDTVIKAIWKKTQVKVSYDANGGSGEMTGSTQDKGSDYTVLPNAFKAPDDTQEFDTWEVNGEKVTAGTAIKIDKDTVIKALWKKIQVNVSYDGNGGKGTMVGKTVDKGSSYTVLKNAFKAPDDTQEFDTWEVNGEKVAAGTAIKIDKDTVIKALWKKIQVNVTYDANGGSGTMEGKKVDKGSDYTVLPNGFKAPDATQEFDTWEVNGQKVAPNAEITLDKDTVVKAIWKDIEYKVTFNGNKGTGNMPEKLVKKGNDYELPANGFTAPENKVFSHWKIGNEDKNPDDKITVNGDTEVKAIWEDIKVKVNYDSNGGSGIMDGAELKKGSTYKLSSNKFTAPENQEFVGWKIGETEYAPDAEITVNEDTEVKAIWKDIKVKVSYEPNGGSGEMKSAIQKKGTKYTLSSNTFTAPENQEFDTWEVDGKKLAPNAEITLDKDTVVKAIWKDIEYKVTFNGNTGTGSMPEKLVKKGNDYELPANGFTAPENKVFSHWKIGNEDKNPGDKITVNGDTEVKAIWKDIKVKVSYSPNGGSGTMEGKELTKGSSYKLLANGFTAPENKKFKGWKVGDKEYAPNAEITVNEDTVVEAVWEDIKVKVSYNSNGGSGTMEGKELTKGSSYKLLANGFIAPANKKFKGWKIGKTEYAPDAEITVNEDTVVEAVWEEIEYKVTFNGNGGSNTMPEEKVKKGNKYKLPKNGFDAPKNKEFDHWEIGGNSQNPGDEITIDGDTEVKAIWKDIMVDVTYNSGGGSGEMTGAAIKKGSTYKLLANGFTAPKNQEFDTWEVDGKKVAPNTEITVDKDTVIKAIWKDKIPETPPAVNYTVSFRTEAGAEGTMPDQTVSKGKYSIPNPTFTAEKGKEFAGWKVGDGTDLKAVGSEIDITGNVTLTAVWEGEVTEKVQVSYEPGEGSGTMDGAKLEKGSKYTLSANTFEAPAKKKFKGWKIGDTEYAAGAEITVDKDTTVTAIWEEIETTPPVKEEVQVSYEPGEGSGTMDGAKLEKGSKYIISANGFEAPDKKKFKGWKIGDTEYAAGAEITVDKDTTVIAVWENVKIDPGKPGDGGNPDNPGTNPDQGGDNPNPGTTPGEGDNPNNPGTTPGEGDNPNNPGTTPGEGDNPNNPGTKPGEGDNPNNPGTKPGEGDNPDNPDNPGTNPDQAGDKPNPGTNPDQGGDNPKPGTTPDQGGDKPKPGTTPDQGGDKPNPEPKPEKPGEVGDSGNPDKKPDDCKDQPNPGHNPGKDSESPRPGTKPNDGENKAKSTGKDTSKKTEGNKENPLDNSKVRVPRTKEVKENVQTGVEPIGQIGGILSAAIAGLFASKKRKK